MNPIDRTSFQVAFRIVSRDWWHTQLPSDRGVLKICWLDALPNLT